MLENGAEQILWRHQFTAENLSGCFKYKHLKKKLESWFTIFCKNNNNALILFKLTDSKMHFGHGVVDGENLK